MFHTAQWSAASSLSAPPLKAIMIWAHLTGVPLDLRYNEGLSLVDGLVGEPKETDDFTRNMVSLTLSHVKVEVDLTQPLPSVVEFERESGEVVEVFVHYPWVPPTCSHCHEMGHILKNCLQYIPPANDPAPAKENGTDSVTAKARGSENFFTPKKSKQSRKKTLTYQPVRTLSTPAVPVSDPAALVVGSETAVTSLASSTRLTAHIPSPMDTSFSSPSPITKPSLKRSRSSPTLSPPSSSNPNPFILKPSFQPIPPLPFPLPLPSLPSQKNYVPINPVLPPDPPQTLLNPLLTPPAPVNSVLTQNFFSLLASSDLPVSSDPQTLSQ